MKREGLPSPIPKTKITLKRLITYHYIKMKSFYVSSTINNLEKSICWQKVSFFVIKTVFINNLKKLIKQGLDKISRKYEQTINAKREYKWLHIYENYSDSFVI